MASGDRQLVEAVLAGDLDRYEELVTGAHEGVWRTVAAIGLDREACRDLVQQAFVDAYRQLSKFRSDGDFGSWARGIARNLARKELRRRSCRYRHEDRLRSHLEQQHQHEEEPDARLAALRRCRDRLSDDSRTVIDRYYGAGDDIDGIAAALKRTAAATKQLLWRSRLALRKCIEAQGEPA